MSTKPQIHNFTWEEIHHRVAALAQRLTCARAHTVYGVPRGGQIIAGLLSAHGFKATTDLRQADAIVDDIVDSGSTRKKFTQDSTIYFDAIVDKLSICDKDLGWVVFPWEIEGEKDISDSIQRVLQFIGEDDSDTSIAHLSKCLNSYQTGETT